MMPSAYLCRGRMEVQFAPVATVEDGQPVVHLVADRALWDGQLVSDVVAEALLLTWCDAHPEDDED